LRIFKVSLAFGIDKLVCLFPTILVEIECENALMICRTFKDFAMTQGAARVVIAGPPMLVHALA
jgi:hypothetical protein